MTFKERRRRIIIYIDRSNKISKGDPFPHCFAQRASTTTTLHSFDNQISNLKNFPNRVITTTKLVPILTRPNCIAVFESNGKKQNFKKRRSLFLIYCCSRCEFGDGIRWGGSSFNRIFGLSLSVCQCHYIHSKFSWWVAKEGELTGFVLSVPLRWFRKRHFFFFGDFSLIIMFLIIDICIDTPLKHMLCCTPLLPLSSIQRQKEKKNKKTG